MDDLGYVFVKVVELVHEEGVLLVRVGGDVLQLVLGRPGDADGVSDDTWIGGRGGRLHSTCQTSTLTITEVFFFTKYG